MCCCRRPTRRRCCNRQNETASTRAGFSGLRDGSFAIWKGPLFDNGGKRVLNPGQVADDAFLRRMAFYVKGVEGRVPS